MNNYIQQSDKLYKLVYTFLSEAGAAKQELPWQDLMVCLKNYLKIKRPDKSFQLLFGDFAILAGEFNLVTQKQLDAVRKYLKKIRGCKLNVRIMPDVRIGKEFYGFAEPDMVMWELSGVSAENAASVLEDVSGMLNMPIKVIGK